MQKQLIQTLKILLAAIVLSFGISYAYAWVGPSSAPPAGNTSAPINTSNINQIKTGSLEATGGLTTLGTVVANEGYFAGAVDVIGDITVDGLSVFNNDIKVNGTVKIANTGSVCDSSTAGQIKFDGANFLGCTGSAVWKELTTELGPYTWTISSNTSNFNMANTFGLGEARDIILTINSGVTVGSTDITIPALSTGNLPAGSTVKVINNGTIVGAAGNGGTGGVVSLVQNAPYLSSNGAKGGNGGTAVSSSLPLITIDNNGIIAGGGGGAGGGSAGWCEYDSGAYLFAGGGGGGGGGGKVAGSGGTGGKAIYNDLSNAGINGSSGSATSGGAGGAGGVHSYTLTFPPPAVIYTVNGGNGGNGGNRGVNGSNGGSASISNCPSYYSSQINSPGAGGSAGSKVVGAVSWI